MDFVERMGKTMTNLGNECRAQGATAMADVLELVFTNAEPELYDREQILRVIRDGRREVELEFRRKVKP